MNHQWEGKCVPSWPVVKRAQPLPTAHRKSVQKPLRMIGDFDETTQSMTNELLRDFDERPRSMTNMTDQSML